jgi:hypothetical protein
MFFCKFYYFVYITECQSRYSIRTAIIYGNTFVIRDRAEQHKGIQR